MIQDIFGLTYDNKKIKIGEYDDGFYCVGGKIFFIDSTSTATYKFYDANKQEISSVAVGDSPYYYQKLTDGNGKEKYYIYDNTTGVSINGKSWGYKGITTDATTDSIGSGKTNTSTILAIEDTSAAASTSIWVTLKTNNQNAVGGCSDWYIPSKQEMMELISSGIVTGFMAWTSVEYNSNQAIKKYSSDTSYGQETKDWNNSMSYLAIRSM